MASDYETSVTRWFNALKAGDKSAVDHLWRGFFDELVVLARKRMGGMPRRAADEEDVAVSVFRCLCDGAEGGRFNNHMDRTDLWRLLVVITRQKIADHIRKSTAQKRGGGLVQGESAFCGPSLELSRRGIEQVVGDAPSPDLLLALEEQQQKMTALLRDETLSQVVNLRLQGYSNEEIASAMSISLRSVERKLNLIRQRWSEELSDAPPGTGSRP